MEREQIIKALECCTTFIGCYECPYNDIGNHKCKLQLFRKSLALIKELTEELEATFGQYTAYQEAATKRMRELTEENERLSDEWYRYKRYYLNHCFDEVIAYREADIKADTVKEMKERLKARCRLPESNETYSISPFRLHGLIDQIAKEMIGETK